MRKYKYWHNQLRKTFSPWQNLLKKMLRRDKYWQNQLRKAFPPGKIYWKKYLRKINIETINWGKLFPLGKIYWKKYWEKIHIYPINWKTFFHQPKSIGKNIEKDKTQSVKKSFLIDPLNTSNAIYPALLALTLLRTYSNITPPRLLQFNLNGVLKPSVRKSASRKESSTLVSVIINMSDTSVYICFNLFLIELILI